MIIARYSHSYHNKVRDIVVFAYLLAGPKREIDKYKKIQRDFYRETEKGIPMYHRTFGKTVGTCPRGMKQLKLKVADGKIEIQ